MLITSPSKKKDVRPNLRRVADRDNSANERRSYQAKDLKKIKYGRRIDKKKKKNKLSFPRLKPWKVILGVFVIGLLGVLYLRHVFATQELLQEVQQLEREYNRAQRLNSEYRLMYDRMIGPAEIYEKAKELGFVNGGPAEKVIEVENR